MIKLSYIIPAYNAFYTIEKTLDSILSLDISPKELQVIVVDDCSSDNTKIVVSEYAQTHVNVELVCQPVNMRQGAARNLGLRYAKGNYIAFADSDDIVCKGVLNVLAWAINSDVDIAYGRMKVQGDVGYSVVDISGAPLGIVLGGADFCENYHTIESCQSPCSYLFKREFLERTNIPFVERRRIEDSDWVEKHLYCAKSIICCDDIIYTYLVNQSSTIHTTRFDTNADWLHFCYRRFLFSEQIAKNMPKFSERIKEAACGGVTANTTFRRLTRFTSIDYIRIRKRCGSSCIKYLSGKRWGGFTNIALNHPIVAFVILSISNPVAKVSRFFVHLIRKYL